MSKTRLEAFSDGVIAIVITIMVLELHTPEGTSWEALRHLLPVVLTYILSFVFIGIYWTNHHHMFQATRHVTGGVLWANLHLLFWLTLVPFATAWMGDHHRAALPNATYGVVLLMAAIAYTFLQTRIIAADGRSSVLAEGVGRDWKGKASMMAYALGIVVAFAEPWISEALYVAVALTWLVPDRRIETRLSDPAATSRAGQ